MANLRAQQRADKSISWKTAIAVLLCLLPAVFWAILRGLPFLA